MCHVGVKGNASHPHPANTTQPASVTVTSMDVAAQAADSPSSQDRHSPAAAPRRLRLGTRLAISVALSVAAVVTLLTVAGLRVAEQLLRNDLVETARLTAVAVADDIEARDE